MRLAILRRAGATILLVVAPLGSGQSYPTIKPLRQTFDIPDVRKANIAVDISSTDGVPLYRLQCHSAGYAGDPGFDYSGDFECRLTSIGRHDAYSTLFTEDSHQSRDWESRARFFARSLRGACASIPQFGAIRSFELRGILLTLKIDNPVFADDGALRSLTFTVQATAKRSARRAIAEVVPVPKVGIPKECKLSEYFVDLPASSKG